MFIAIILGLYLRLEELRQRRNCHHEPKLPVIINIMLETNG
jgi:hypothetical protein